MLTGEPEAPEFPDTVPDTVAKAVAAMWIALHDCDRERDLLDRLVVDGEFLELDDGTISSARRFRACHGRAEVELRAVIGYKIGTASRARMSGLRYMWRPAHGRDPRPAVDRPGTAIRGGLLNARTGAAHAIGTMAKVAAVIANASPDRITATAGARSGLVDRPGLADAPREPIHAVGVGSVPFMRPGEEVKRIQAGPDEAARKYEAQLERDVASALNMPLSELLSDYSSGSFSNLRMAWADALVEKTRRRRWWHRHYRLPLYLEALSTAFAEGRLPRMSMAVMAEIKRPAWRGPKRQPPQPEKEAQSLALLAREGILTPDAAREELEN